AEDGIRDFHVTGVQTCALPISTGDVPGPRPPDPGVWVPAPPAARPGPGRGRARGGVVTVRWNPGRPRRCPECNTIVHTAGPVTWRAVTECCRCGTRFARGPRLGWLLPVRRCAAIAHGSGAHYLARLGAR